jgi:hypothetical protein
MEETKRKNKRWSLKEIDIITSMYPVATCGEIAKKVGLKKDQVQAAVRRFGIEKQSVHTPEQRKMLRVVGFMKYLLRGSRTVSELSIKYCVNQRTIYRYIKLLESLDVEVEQDFSGRFFIPQVCCPLCGHDKEGKKKHADLNVTIDQFERGNQ